MSKDKATEALLQEQFRKDRERASEWLKEAKNYYRIARKKDRTQERRWDPESGALPTSEEIYANRGWPAPEEEKVLKKIFFHSFRDNVIERLGDQRSRVESTLVVLYGIYLMNYVLGGILIK